jgi:hypothetical protein
VEVGARAKAVWGGEMGDKMSKFSESVDHNHYTVCIS